MSETQIRVWTNDSFSGLLGNRISASLRYRIWSSADFLRCLCETFEPKSVAFVSVWGFCFIRFLGDNEVVLYVLVYSDLMIRLHLSCLKSHFLKWALDLGRVPLIKEWLLENWIWIWISKQKFLRADWYFWQEKVVELEIS